MPMLSTYHQGWRSSKPAWRTRRFSSAKSESPSAPILSNANTHLQHLRRIDLDSLALDRLDLLAHLGNARQIELPATGAWNRQRLFAQPCRRVIWGGHCGGSGFKQCKPRGQLAQAGLAHRIHMSSRFRMATAANR